MIVLIIGKERMMKKVKRFFLAGLLLVGATAAWAQDEIETTISGDVVSSYIWRGQDLGDVSLQPTLGVSYKGLSLTAWGSVGLIQVRCTWYEPCLRGQHRLRFWCGFCTMVH